MLFNVQRFTLSAKICAKWAPGMHKQDLNANVCAWETFLNIVTEFYWRFFINFYKVFERNIMKIIDRTTFFISLTYNKSLLLYSSTIIKYIFGNVLFSKSLLHKTLSNIQKLAKTWIYFTPYVCTDRIFDSRPFMNNKIFLKKLLWKFVAHIFMLLLAHFESKLVN